MEKRMVSRSQDLGESVLNINGVWLLPGTHQTFVSTLFLHLSVCIENHKFILIHPILIQHQGVYFSSYSFCICKSSSNSEKAGSHPPQYTFLINPLDCEISPVHFHPPPNSYPSIPAQACTSPIRPPLHAAAIFIQFGLMLVVPMPGYSSPLWALTPHRAPL